AASLISGEKTRSEEALLQTAATIDAWFDSPGCTAVTEAAKQIARCSSAIILGSDYGLPVALETALKLKEASYLHAEGFAAGEFRHGSVAMVDAQCAVIGIVDADALPIVERPMREVRDSEALRYSIGSCSIEDVPSLGPTVEDPYNTLAWLVTAQMI